MNAIRHFLSRPFLMWEYTAKRKLIVILSVQAYIFFFFSYFTPFDYNNVTKDTLLFHILVNSVCNTFVLSIFYFVVPLGFKGYFKDKSRTIFREIIWVLTLLLTYMLGHRYINNNIFELPYHSISTAIGLAISTSIFPIFSLLLLAIIRMTKENKNRGEDISNQLIEISANVGKDKIKLLMKDILYIKSLDNYSEIYFTDGGKIEKKLLRIPIGTLSLQLQSTSQYFVRSHRSYIVNLYNIKAFKKDSYSSKIYLKGNNIALSVSKSRRTEVFSQLDKLPIAYFT